MSSKRRLRRKACVGKAQHADQESAMIQAQRSGKSLRVYRCQFGSHWHVGHEPRGKAQARKEAIAARVFGIDCVPAPDAMLAVYEERLEKERLWPMFISALLRENPSQVTHNFNGANVSLEYLRAWAYKQAAQEAKERLQWSGFIFPKLEEVAKLIDSKGHYDGEPRRTDQGNQRATQGDPYSITSPHAGLAAQQSISGYGSVYGPQHAGSGISAGVTLQGLTGNVVRMYLGGY